MALADARIREVSAVGQIADGRFSRVHP